MPGGNVILIPEKLGHDPAQIVSVRPGESGTRPIKFAEPQLRDPIVE